MRTSSPEEGQTFLPAAPLTKPQRLALEKAAGPRRSHFDGGDGRIFADPRVIRRLVSLGYAKDWDPFRRYLATITDAGRRAVAKEAR